MTTPTPTQPLHVTIHPEGAGPARTFWSGDGPSFSDFLDTINPLQHIPVISNLYQSLTGDVISPGAKIIGGALFGGPIGLLASIFNGIIEQNTGKDFIGNLVASAEGEPPSAPVSPGEPYLSPNQRAAYNAYTHTQDLLKA